MKDGPIRRFPVAAIGWLSATLLVAGASADGPAVDAVAASRVPWTTSRVSGTPEPPPPYAILPAYPALRFDHPTDVVPVPGTRRLLVAEEKGRISTFETRPDVASSDLLLDLSAVPGLDHVFTAAFHPRFEETRWLYVVYALEPKREDGTRLSRFTVSSSDPPIADPASEQIVLEWRSGGHNGSHLLFGPDGMLYVSTGDSGDATPPDASDTGQAIDDLLASILRIDVDHGGGDRPYAIPSDNPFLAVPGARGEVWAYGLRNPWRMCFDDRGTLWVADVGWELWEMLYHVRRGGNYGWSVTEGPQPVAGERSRGSEPIQEAVIAHPHTESRSITGGYVSSTSRLPELVGTYVYGDYVTGKVWGARHDGERITWRGELADSRLALSTFGRDHDGEVLLVDYDTGTLHRLVPRASEANALFPRRLSDTGIFADVAAAVPATGVVPYSVNAPAWGDGASSVRLLGLPGEGTLRIEDRQNPQQGHIRGKFRFPEGGVLVKTLSLDTTPGVPGGERRVETQVLHFDGERWRAYAYLWNDDQTDAELVGAEGTTVALEVADVDDPAIRHRREHRVVSRTECLTCHSSRGGTLYGFVPAQLRRTVTDERGDAVDQLESFAARGLLTAPIDPPPAPFPDPGDPAQPLEARARAYLAVNCSTCHLRGGGGASEIDLRYDQSLERTKLVDGRPTHGTLGLDDPALVRPGDPSRSVVWYRMATLGPGRMPHFGSTVVDEAGLELVGGWIESLGSPPVSAADLPSGEASPSAALAVLHRIARAEGPERDRLVAWGIRQRDPRVRGLFDRFVPEEARGERLGDTIDQARLLAIPGDVARGRGLWESAALSCRGCHAPPPGGDGTPKPPVGPDLAGLGTRSTAAEILESVVHPSRKIDPKHAAWHLETVDGRVVVGLLVERDEEAVVVRNERGEDERFERAAIEALSPQPRSLMPDHLLRGLSPAEAADLLAFLRTL